MKNIQLTNPLPNINPYFYSTVLPTKLSNPKLISYSKNLALSLGFNLQEIQSQEFIDMINGTYLPNGGEFFSYAYAGHQFGYFVSHLGDGRAINLGKLNNYHLQLKGAGRTPYSRNGDGRAVLRSSIREYLMSEAMYGLGIPTSRAVAIINSTSTVYRETNESCSIVLRAASSWIRFGSFEYAYSSEEGGKEKLEDLANLVINDSYPELKNHPNKYDEMYFKIVDKTIDLMVHWQSVGFMHGVMNTDNMSIDGITIDYGPYAFMEEFKKEYICNRSDYDGRYSFDNQPFIAQWNLSILAQVLSPITNYEIINTYNDTFIGKFKIKYFAKMALKLGLINTKDDDTSLILDMFLMLEYCDIDYTPFFYFLSCARYDDIILMTEHPEELTTWLDRYKYRVSNQNISLLDRLKNMKQVNPKFILKNYILQEIIKECENGDFTMLNDFLDIAHNPYSEHKKYDKYALPTPKNLSGYICSCSS
jgi:uncharacterized protein YdiU (UPF0061 family)